MTGCWLGGCWLEKDYVWGSFWHHFGVILESPGVILGPLGTIVGHLGTNLLHVGPCIELMQFPGHFLTPWGIPFSASGITFSFSVVWNAENLRFCGQPGSRSDCGTKSDQFLERLGWLKPWFGVGGVVKITCSLELGFSRSWVQFLRSF